MCRKCHRAWHQKNGPGSNDHLLPDYARRLPKNPNVLTVDQAAGYAQVSKVTVYNWIKQEGLPVEYQGRRFRIRQSTLRAWLEVQRDPRYSVGGQDPAAQVLEQFKQGGGR